MTRLLRFVLAIALIAGCTGFALFARGLWIPAKAQVAQILLDRAWQQSRNTGESVKAWPWADSWPIARLRIPALGLESIVLKEAGGEGLAFGPVHLDQSAGLGASGMSIIAAHRDTHFRALKSLEVGAKIEIETQKGERLTYQVERMRIAPWDQSGLYAQGNQDWLALTSCWPFDDLKPGPLRFIAEARRIEYPVSKAHN